ncbi:cytochrome P450 family protein [Streptomyces clavuligerus]|nr:cytochrome P450 [Streptomyces clavuligerus]MBY6305367.1 cytochrome P450 [Streptomyces clavuligerus]QPL65287.1 cytochrome P450 [Streptomyces clavuligerus]QPL71318.1 cytochrome P450 [Streptomyces clavuligerus]QPL77400.1 cytochrome P450 [Streptomyces clavuligerus]QPL83425.1 cytochrome P450 [Streptomyces clavuligerus]
MSTPPAVDLLQLSPDFERDPFPVYAALRAQGQVHRVRVPRGMDLYLIVGHEACRAAYTEPRFSRDWVGSGHLSTISEVDPDQPVLTHMLLTDPPVHTRLRRLVTREFTPRRIEALAPRVQRITDDLLDAMLADGKREADLVPSFAFPLPMAVICELLGVPALDRTLFSSWSREIVAPMDPAAEKAAYEQMGVYLLELIAAKRADPGEDLLSGLIHTVDEGGDRLSPQELVGMCAVLLVAGHETTVNLIGNGVRALHAHPEQLAELRADWSLLDGAVEEILRYDGPVENSTIRVVLEDVELSGVTIPKGSAVLIAQADADRDPERFDAPDTFDIHRDSRGHIAFGHGIHHCLGAPLARLEARIAFRSLLERCPRLEVIKKDRELPWAEGMLIRGVKELPVRW